MARVTLMGQAVFPLWWIAATSASAAEDLNLFMVMHYVWMGPLSVGVGLMESEAGLSERK